MVNKTIDIFNQISRISKDLTIYEHELYLMVLGRLACNISIVIADAPTFAEAVEEHDGVFIMQSILRYVLWFGTVIVVDILCLGYITAAGMYRNIGDHMILFAKRIEKSETCSMTTFRRMQMLCDFSEELDKCSAIYSQVFTVTQGFHKLFQFYIFFTLYMELLIVISNMHRVFLAYMADNVINWSKLAVSLIQAIDFLLLMLLADLVSRRSRIPKYLNLDVLCSDIESRWDRSFLETANKTIEILIRITVITKDLRICGPELYLIIPIRVLSSFLLIVTDIPNFRDVFQSKDPVFVVQNILGYMLAQVTYSSLDVVCLVFVINSRMYRIIGNHMVRIAERIKISEKFAIPKSQRKLMYDEYCAQLEECSEMHSEIFKIVLKFHSMLQLIIFLNFNFTIISVINGVHVCFVNYLKFGEILWFLLAQTSILFVNLLLVIFCADLMVQRSKIPTNFDWESLSPQLCGRWDRCVYQFLAQMRLEDLQISVFGLFSLNRELCLRVFSMIVGYLTIVIQFSMMGYFGEES
ncbi:gustatory receptor for bitter taste 93a-like [Eupeodes corollae]|uniref:gustatory receptor for bitter taste 93a-like n=1 Tax=Eupeodes corollae TaxID=290404 RepID=UPI002493079C|nr:gustatory receptor for bitter taste 93a-like [Eupeodes corollae]